MGKFIRLRSIWVKFFAGIAGIGTGLSLGREGPSVQLGAGVGEVIGKLFRMKGTDKNKLIAAGAGSAIAATFNAPIAGTIFVLEELVNKFSSNLLFPVLIATVCADSLSRYILGNRPCFFIPAKNMIISPNVIFACIILGIISAIFGIIFAKLIFFNNKMFLKIKIPNYFKPAIAGFIVGLVGLFIPFILGSGNIAVDFLLMHKFQIGLICLIFLLKLFLTPLCFGSGAAGGIFLPTLMLGAFLGYIIASLLNFCGIQVDYILMSVLGMGAFLAAVARTPITAAVMVFEMTGSYNFILPIMLCAAIADLTAEKLGHKPIYSMLIVQDMLNSSNMNDLAEVKVKNIMIREVSNFQIKDTIIDVKNKFNNTEYEIYPVLNKKKLCGYITKANFEDLLFQNVLTSIEIEKYMNPNPITITENENLYIAYYKLHSNDINCLFVVDKFNNLKGILTREDIMSCPAFINKLK
jgi:H+/Cl- antiporter ClcA